MTVILFVVKKFINFIRVDFLLLKSINKMILLSAILATMAIWLWKIFNINESLTDIISSISSCWQWVMYVYFFRKLREQHFFRHLTLNRSFFHVESELIVFLLSILFIFFVFHICFLLHNQIFDNVKNYLFISLLLLVDALFFTATKLWKYLLFQLSVMIITTALYFSFSFVNYNFIFDATNTIDYIYKIAFVVNDAINSQTRCSMMVNLFVLLAEFIFITKTLKK